jgi:hypothetical protein
MSFAIVRFQKFKVSDVRGIQVHDNRERESLTNPDLDKTRQMENYTLVESTSFNADIKERLEPVKANMTKVIRKDAVVMCQMLVTSDKKFFDSLTLEKEKEFFQQSLDFIADRYGHENIISAVVHKDEKTPHMHVNFTPIKEGKLAANAIFDKKELAALQTDFHASVGKSWDLNRGESREDKRRHQDVATFKRTTAQAELEKVEAKLANAKVLAAELEKTKAELEKAKTELANYNGLNEGTARAMAKADTWAIEKARQENERVQKERERQAAFEKTKAEEKARQQTIRGPSLAR